MLMACNTHVIATKPTTTWFLIACAFIRTIVLAVNVHSSSIIDVESVIADERSSEEFDRASYLQDVVHSSCSRDEQNMIQRGMSYVPLTVSGKENAGGSKPGILSELDAVWNDQTTQSVGTSVDQSTGLRQDTETASVETGEIIGRKPGILSKMDALLDDETPQSKGIAAHETSEVELDDADSVDRMRLDDADRLHKEVHGLGEVGRGDHPEAVLGGLLSMLVGTEAGAREVAGISAKQLPLDHATKIPVEVLEWLVKEISTQTEQLITFMHTVLQQVRVWDNAIGGSVSSRVQEFFSTMEKVISYYHYFVPDAADVALVVDVVQEFISELDFHGRGFAIPEDFQRVGEKFGIVLLSTVEDVLDIFDQFDADSDGKLDFSEIVHFVTSDDGRKTAVAVVSALSVQLSSVVGAISGETARGPLRQAMAEFVVTTAENNASMGKFFGEIMGGLSLTEPCVSDERYLCSFGIPFNFTAEILGQLAIFAHRVTMPDQADSVGLILIEQIHRFSNATLPRLLDVLGNTAWWDEMGFPLDQHAEVVETVTRWALVAMRGNYSLDAVLYSLDGNPVSRQLPFEFCDAEPETCPARAREVMNGRVARHRQAAQLRSVLSVRNTSEDAIRVGDLDISQMFKGSQMASNETLRFVSLMTRMFSQKLSSLEKYTQPIVNIAVTMEGIVQRMSNFIRVFRTYSSVNGSQKLEQTIRNFSSQLTSYVSVILDTTEGIREVVSLSHVDQEPVGKDQLDTLMVGWEKAQNTLEMLNTVLPPMVEDMQKVRSLVRSSARKLETVFDQITDSGPNAIFTFGAEYRVRWIAHYVLWMSFLGVALLFSIYAHSFARGSTDEQSEEEEEYIAPETFTERLQTFYGSVTKSFHVLMYRASDSYVLFWSVLLLAQGCVLVLANATLLLASFAGLEMFVLEGCKDLHILNSETHCNSALETVSRWLPLVDSEDMFSCRDDKLLSCVLVQEQLWFSMSITTMFNLFATLLSFQLIINSGCDYEYMFWRRRVTGVYADLDFVGKNPEKEE